jgi:hypothetical protein
MTASALDRIGPSESQAIANRTARAESRYRQRTDRERREDERTVDTQRTAHWRSKRDANRTDPPRQLDALLAWFQREIDLDLPEALHGRGVWFDTVNAEDRRVAKVHDEPEPKPSGGSMIGTPRTAPAFAARVEGSPHAKDDNGELLSPLRSAFAALRGQNRDVADLLEVVARHNFAWQGVVGRPFYRPGPAGGPRRLAFLLSEDIVRTTLMQGLTWLWEIQRKRMPFVGVEE